MKGKRYLKEPLVVIGWMFFISSMIMSGLLLMQGMTLFDEDVFQDTGLGSLVKEEEFYLISDEATAYQEVIFETLKNTHELYVESPSESHTKSYVEAVVVNFVADFYTLSNKKNRNDVGGLPYVHLTYREAFKTEAGHQMYLYLDSYLQNYEQYADLTVSDVIISDITKVNEATVIDSEEKMMFVETFSEFYEVSLSFEYETTASLLAEQMNRELILTLAQQEDGKWGVVAVLEKGGDEVE